MITVASAGGSSGSIDFTYILLIVLIAVIVVRSRRKRAVARANREALGMLARGESSSFGGTTGTAAPPNSDSGTRTEQLSRIADLRDKGALSEQEFQAEKKRILES